MLLCAGSREVRLLAPSMLLLSLQWKVVFATCACYELGRGRLLSFLCANGVVAEGMLSW